MNLDISVQREAIGIARERLYHENEELSNFNLGLFEVELVLGLELVHLV